uniref:Peptidase M13 N-terminal domain-containing protein n=1 Tax=Eptatretus burgeri TaxID=7764 RepID=A0A8C4X0E8_EPTBU
MRKSDILRRKKLRQRRVGFSYRRLIDWNSALIKKRSGLERLLFAVIFILSLVLLVCIIALIVNYQNDLSRTLCLTETCVQISGSILASVNWAVDPCEDFYKYACGGWVKKNPLPDGQSRWNTFNNLIDHNQAIIRNFLENKTMNVTSEAERKARKFYVACMHEDRIEELGSKPLEDVIEKVFH